MEVHVGFCTFIIKYIFMPLSTTKTKKSTIVWSRKIIASYLLSQLSSGKMHISMQHWRGGVSDGAPRRTYWNHEPELAKYEQFEKVPKGGSSTLNNRQENVEDRCLESQVCWHSTEFSSLWDFFFLNRFSKVYWLCPSIGISRVAVVLKVFHSMSFMDKDVGNTWLVPSWAESAPHIAT